MKRQSPHQKLGILHGITTAILMVMLCACSQDVLAQWTQPDGSGNINSTNTGNVGIGTTAPAAKLTVSTNTQTAPAGQPGTVLQIVGANGTSSRVVVDSFGAVISSIDMRRANNTALSPTGLLNGDNIGQLTWQGRGASSYNAASRAKIWVGAAETYTDTAQGAFMVFSLAPRGGINTVEAMRIDATGFVGIGTPAPAFRLDVQSGQINASVAYASPAFVRTIGRRLATVSGLSEVDLSITQVVTSASALRHQTQPKNLMFREAALTRLTGYVLMVNVKLHGPRLRELRSGPSVARRSFTTPVTSE